MSYDHANGIDLDEHPLLPAAPFAKWLNEEFQRQGSPGPVVFARRLGLDAPNVLRLMDGTQPCVHVDMVDKALTRSGAHLWQLYPELYPEIDEDLFGEIYERTAIRRLAA